MDICWEKIKEGLELFQRESTSIFVVPDVGRVYVTEKDERMARLMGGNPSCRIEVALANVGDNKPLFVIANMERDSLVAA